jgi:hypothetical protein
MRRFSVLFLRRAFLILLSLSFVAFLSGCGLLNGACIASGGSLVECYEDWSQSDCDTFNADNVNGSSWTFYPASSCASQGWSYWCGDGGSEPSSHNGYWTTGAYYCIY